LKGREIVSLAVAGSRMLAGTDRGLFALTTPEGAWRPLALSADPGAAPPRVNDLAVLRGGVVAAATSTGLFRSEDSGVTWSPALLGAGDITAVALSPPLSVAATERGLQESRDLGRTWRALPAGPGRARVNAVAVLPGPFSVIVAATSQGLYRSGDEGLSWSLGGELPESDFTSIAMVPGGGTVFASDFTWGGVYRSDDRGANWTRLQATGLASERVWALGLDPAMPLDLLAASLVGGLHLLRWPEGLP
jgi:photosystem II stability/assembly factor-like uncharacterized protein